MTPASPYILLDDQITSRIRLYENPVDIISVTRPGDVDAGFRKLIKYHTAGYHIAGNFSYELGYILEPKLRSKLPRQRHVPLMSFGAFEGFSDADADLLKSASLPELSLTPDWNEEDYAKRFDILKAYIEAGDCYQANLTFPLRGETDASAFEIYKALRARQPGQYGGVASLGGPEIISLSPELFFSKLKSTMTMRPMKGTQKRSPDAAKDKAAATSLAQDTKNTSENLMIVDLLRNDLSRISKPGSVEVPELYALETYPTLHQMVSVIRAELKPDANFETIIRSLFPSGSITGAPKIRAMEIIRELEAAPRGAYCGSLGYLDPNGDACFNVGIRTLTLKDNQLTYNVGSGVVMDSTAEDEYAECLLKAKVILGDTAPKLIETLRWTPDRKFVRRDLHLSRLARSASALGYHYAKDDVVLALKNAVKTKGKPQRVRLTLSEDGLIAVTTSDYTPPEKAWKISLSKNPLTLDVQNIDHKTTDRDFYDGERTRIKSLTSCDEVLFFNEKDELCEGSFTSVFIEKSGQLKTPALTCGLLPGVFRQSLLESGKAVEAVLTQEDLKTADLVFVGNSLRGLIQAEINSLERL